MEYGLKAFNNFYVSIGKDLAAKFPSSPVVDLVDIDNHRQCSSRFVDTKEVKSTIRQLSTNKSTCVKGNQKAV